MTRINKYNTGCEKLDNISKSIQSFVTDDTVINQLKLERESLVVKKDKLLSVKKVGNDFITAGKIHDIGETIKSIYNTDKDASKSQFDSAIKEYGSALQEYNGLLVDIDSINRRILQDETNVFVQVSGTGSVQTITPEQAEEAYVQIINVLEPVTKTTSKSATSTTSTTSTATTAAKTKPTVSTTANVEKTEGGTKTNTSTETATSKKKISLTRTSISTVPSKPSETATATYTSQMPSATSTASTASTTSSKLDVDKSTPPVSIKPTSTPPASTEKIKIQFKQAYQKDVSKCQKGPSAGGYSMDELRVIAESLGIPTKGRIKSDICADIDRLSKT